jgi:hypothetical protein
MGMPSIVGCPAGPSNPQPAVSVVKIACAVGTKRVAGSDNPDVDSAEDDEISPEADAHKLKKIAHARLFRQRVIVIVNAQYEWEGHWEEARL